MVSVFMSSKHFVGNHLGIKNATELLTGIASTFIGAMFTNPEPSFAITNYVMG